VFIVGSGIAQHRILKIPEFDAARHLDYLVIDAIN
jgi:hypothetical protein